MDLELWRPHERYIAICAKCGREGLKKNMSTILIKENSYRPVRTLCHLCSRCLPQLLDELEVSMPD